MSMVTVRAHYDGKQILLDEPLQLAARARLLVTLLTDRDSDRDDWSRVSARGLAAAYGADEDDYPMECIREANPAYEGG